MRVVRLELALLAEELEHGFSKRPQFPLLVFCKDCGRPLNDFAKVAVLQSDCLAFRRKVREPFVKASHNFSLASTHSFELVLGYPCAIRSVAKLVLQLANVELVCIGPKCRSRIVRRRHGAFSARESLHLLRMEAMDPTPVAHWIE